MSDDSRIVTPEIRGDEIDSTMRPQALDEFVGQAQARARRARAAHRSDGGGMACEEWDGIDIATGCHGAMAGLRRKDGADAARQRFSACGMPRT